jgi:hypothetical protein
MRLTLYCAATVLVLAGCENGDRGAYNQCKEAIEARLVSPGSAVFPQFGDDAIRVTTDPKWPIHKVYGHVDSQNRMGALMRTYFECTVSEGMETLVRTGDTPVQPLAGSR